MGFFKRKKLVIYCDNCRNKINDFDFVWIDDHKFCQSCAAEIQGGAPNVLVQGGVSIQGINADSHNYEMPIDDICFVNNRGTVLYGNIKKGSVRLNDVVCIGGRKFLVIGIECSGTIIREALCGMNVGILINCLTPHIFTVGDIVTGEPVETKPKSFTSKEIDELKNYATKFLPQAMNTPEAFKTVVESLSKTIPTINASIMDANVRSGLESAEFSGVTIGEFYIMLATEIEKWLSFTNKEKVMETVNELSDDNILALWISLDMFASVLEDANKESINQFCESIIKIAENKQIRPPKFHVPEPCDNQESDK